VLLEEFYELNREKLISVLARYSGDSEAAEDAVQEAFLKALNNRDILAYLPEKPLWSWLYTTAKNALIDEKRKASRQNTLEDYDKADSTGDFATTIIVKELLHKLPENLMHVVSLRYYGGLNATEIGRLLGKPPATVRSQLRIGIQLLKKQV
jgi:RNA polymerase sigma-70 factor (ECF subfamily)